MMNNRKPSNILSEIIDECIDDLLRSSDEEIDILFSEQHIAQDLQAIKSAAQAAIIKQRKSIYSMAKAPMANSTITNIEQIIHSFTQEKIEALLSSFFSSPESAQIGLAFRNENHQSKGDRASLLADLALKGLIKLDAELH